MCAMNYGQTMVLEVGKQFALATVPGLEANATEDTKLVEIEKVLRSPTGLFCAE